MDRKIGIDGRRIRWKMAGWMSRWKTGKEKNKRKEARRGGSGREA